MRKKLGRIILSIIVVLLLAAGGYALFLWNSVKETADKIHDNVTLKNHAAPQLTNSHPQPISILLLGVDQRKNDVGRSDTAMLLTVNPEKKKTQIISIPRDTQVNIPGHGVHKMNAAYAYGGPALAMQTVENFTGIKINYYVRVNMQTLSSLVDAVDGITVNNTLDWIDEGYYKKGYHFTKGKIQLDGAKALGFVRMRHLDPNGDFGRNERQRKVMTAIINKAANIQSITRYTNILNALGNNVKTNMTFNDMKNIVTNFRNARSNIQQYEVQGNGTTINGVYYLMVNDAEKTKLNNMLKENLSS